MTYLNINNVIINNMSLISKSDHKHSFERGFTLIELLVVIAIIGILASVVLASLNSARIKGQIASIKSNLKNMIPQAELAYDVPGNYSTVCTTDTKIADMITSITNAGGTAKCYSYDNTRWGAAARLNLDPTQNFAVDSMGVVTFDASYGPDPSMIWGDANTFCTSKNGRLPSIEELEALANATYVASGNTTYIPPTFLGTYWSSTTVPSNSALAYKEIFSTGVVGSNDKVTTGAYVRCVH